MKTLAPGLAWWQAPHPEWPGEEAGWGPEVSSYALLGGDAPVLLDPLAPPAEVGPTASAVVILTCAWHARDAAALAAAGAEVHAPEPPAGLAAHAYSAGGTLPGGIEAHAAFFPGECALWLPSHRALVVGESLYGAGGGVRLPPPEWLPEGVTLDDFKAQLAPLAALEPEWFLPAHGEPLAGAAAELRAALAA